MKKIAKTGLQTDAEQTDSERTGSERTDSERTDSERTNSERTDSERTDSEQTTPENRMESGITHTLSSTAQLAFLSKYRLHKRIVTTARILLLVIFLSVWELTASHQIIDSFIFSSPSKIARCFLDMVLDRSIFRHLGVTLYETIVSFFLVIIVSILAAILLWFSKKLSEILEPYLVVLNSLPKSALAPLLIVWLGATRTTIIVAGMSVAVFGSILNLYTSFMSTDPGKMTLIRTLGGKRHQVLTKVVLPSSIPAIISNMKVNIGLCLVGVIIGEFLAAREGLGYLIIYSSQVFKMDWLLMSICLLCLFAMCLYAVINLLESWYLKKR